MCPSLILAPVGYKHVLYKYSTVPYLICVNVTWLLAAFAYQVCLPAPVRTCSIQYSTWYAKGVNNHVAFDSLTRLNCVSTYVVLYRTPKLNRYWYGTSYKIASRWRVTPYRGTAPDGMQFCTTYRTGIKLLVHAL